MPSASALNVTIRCSDCGRTLAVFYKVPPGVAPPTGPLLDWHRKQDSTCSASGTITAVGFPREPGPPTT